MRTLGPQSPAVHDGFATIHGAPSTTGKFARARSAAPHPGHHRALTPHSCHGSVSAHCRACAPRTMEPLWEEKGGGAGRSPVVGEKPSTPAIGVSRRERTAPWWDIATRRSRYRSCPAFSPSNVVCALEHTVSSVTDRLERLASSPDLKDSEAEELRQTVAALKKHSSAMSHSLSNGLLSLERQKSYDSVSSVSSTLSGGSMAPYRAACSYRGGGGPATPGAPHCNGVVAKSTSGVVSIHPAGSEAGLRSENEADNKLKKRSWLRNSFRKAFGRKRIKQSHEDANNADTKRHTSSAGGTTLLSRLLNNQTNSQTIAHDLPVNHCRNAAVSCLNHKPNETYGTDNGILGTQKSICDVRNGSLNGHLNTHDMLTGSFTRSFDFREKTEGDHCQQLLPTMNSTLSINPFGLLEAPPGGHRSVDRSHPDVLTSNSTSPKSGSKSLDHLDECCRSQASSVRNSGHYTIDSTELLYPTSCTAALLRDSLQGKGDVSSSQLQEELEEKKRALIACQLQLMEAQEQLSKHADTIASMQLECQRLGQQKERLVTVLKHHLGPAADTVLAAALSTLTISSPDQQENSSPEPLQPCSAIPPYVSSTLPRPSSAGRRLKVEVVRSETGLVNAADALKIQPETESLQLVGSVMIWPKTSWTDLDDLLHDIINVYTQKVFHGPCKTSLVHRSSSPATEDTVDLHSVHSSKRAISSDFSARSYVFQNKSTAGTSFSSNLNSGLGSNSSKQAPSSGQKFEKNYIQPEKDDSGSLSSNSSMFIYCYRIAEVLRASELLPELLPYGYSVGNVTEIYLWLKGVVSNGLALGEKSSQLSQSTLEKKEPQSLKSSADASRSSESSKGTSVRRLQDSDTSAASFFSNIPQETISSLASALEESQRLLICGPPGSGKTSLVRALARYVSASNAGKTFSEASASSSDTVNSSPRAKGGPKTPSEEDPVTWFTVSGTNGLQLCHLLTSVMRQSSYSNSSEKCSEKSTESSRIGNCVPNINNKSARNFSNNNYNNYGCEKPLRVVVIEDLHLGCGVSETIERCLSGYTDVAFVVTTQQPSHAHTSLSRVCGFRCVELRANLEPVSGLLGRGLRRRILGAELQTQQPLPQMDIIVAWLEQLWMHLNTVTLAPSDELSAHCNTQSPAFLPRSLQRSPGSPSCISDKFSCKYAPGFASSGRNALECGQPQGDFSNDIALPSSRANFSTSRSNQAADQSSSSSGFSKLFLSPSVFMDCPMDLIKSQKWFLKTWNYSVVPQLRKMLFETPNNSPSSNGSNYSNAGRGEEFQNSDDYKWRSTSNNFHREAAHLSDVPITNFADPLQWVLSTYPWPASVDFGSHNLVSLREINAPQLPRPQAALFHSPAPSTPTLPPKEKRAFMSDGIYAVPSIRPASKLSPTPNPNVGMVSDSVGSSNACSGFSRSQKPTPDNKSEGAGEDGMGRKPYVGETLHDTSSESVVHDVPSSMALIVPFSTVAMKNKEVNYSSSVSASNDLPQNEVLRNGYGSSTSYDTNFYGGTRNYCERSHYRPLKSFGNYSKSHDSAQQSVSVDSNKESTTSNPGSSPRQASSCNSKKDFSRGDNTGGNKIVPNSTLSPYRFSGSHSSGSDEVMDSVSSSPTTIPNEPIYFTIQKDSGKSESPDDSDMDTEPIYFTIPGDPEDTSNSSPSDVIGVNNRATYVNDDNPKLPNRSPLMCSGYKNISNDQSDTVVISCRQDSKSKIIVKNTARTLTSTFKPFETTM